MGSGCSYRRRTVVALAALASCLLAGRPAAAATNLSFDTHAGSAESVPGWRVRTRAAVARIETETAGHGAQSLRIVSESDTGDVRVTQRVATRGLTGNRVRISALVRSERAQSSTSLWVRIDGADTLLFVDRESQTPAAPTDTGGGWSRISIEAPLAASAERLTFGASIEGPARVWLDDFRIEPYSTAELRPASSRAQRYVECALAIMREHALVRERVDWPALRTATLAQTRGANAPADAHLAVQFALTALGDGHSHFMPPDRMRRLARAPVSNTRTGRPPVEAASHAIGDFLGYLRVPGFGGGSPSDQVAYAEDLQNRIEALDAPARCGWIIDLRGNSGGNLWPMLLGLGPLLGDGELGAARLPDGTREPIAYRDGKVSLDGYVQLRVRRRPYRLAHASVPVAVLVDGRTASSGEIVALFLAARDGTRSFGTPTRGVATGTRTFPLSDGAALVLTVATTSNRLGRAADGPLEPDVLIEPARATSAAPADMPLRAATDWISSRPGCGDAPGQPEPRQANGSTSTPGM